LRRGSPAAAVLQLWMASRAGGAARAPTGVSCKRHLLLESLFSALARTLLELIGDAAANGDLLLAVGSLLAVCRF
jgi:hypothetical protein